MLRPYSAMLRGYEEPSSQTPGNACDDAQRLVNVNHGR
jgi:hypothetical protein